MRSGAALVIVLAGSACGRIGFDAGSDAGAGIGMGDGAALDAGVPDLVVHFPFDEADGAVLVDVASGMTTTCRNTCPTREISGRVGGAMEFNGGDTCLVVADDVVLHPSSFTIALWARHDIKRNDSMIAKLIGTTAGEQNSFQLEAGDGGFLPADALVFATSAGGPNDYVTSPANAASPNVWHHLAVTFAGGTKDIYVDGAFVATGTGVVDFDGGAMTIGCDQNEFDQQYWDGALDDVRIYRRALTGTEISALAAM